MLRERLEDAGVSISQDAARNFMGKPGNPKEYPLRPAMLAACRRLRQVMPTALLTNNVREWRAGWRAALDVPAHFSLVVDSSEVGVRKPEAAIYKLVEDGLGLEGASLLFIDDLGVNLKPARALGWQTLKYEEMGSVLKVLDAVAEANGG